MWLSGKESANNAGDTGLISGLGRSPGEGNGRKGISTHSSSLAWKIPQRSLAGYRPWGCRRVRHDLATKQQQCQSIKNQGKTYYKGTN